MADKTVDLGLFCEFSFDSCSLFSSSLRRRLVACEDGRQPVRKVNEQEIRGQSAFWHEPRDAKQSSLRAFPPSQFPSLFSTTPLDSLSLDY